MGGDFQWIDRSRPGLERWLQAKFPLGREDAEDIAQEARFVVLSKCEGSVHDLAGMSYLRTVAAYLALNWSRKRHRLIQTLHQFRDVEDGAPWHEFSKVEARCSLDRLCAHCGVDFADAEALGRILLGEATYADLARASHLQEGTLRKRLDRVRARLRNGSSRGCDDF